MKIFLDSIGCRLNQSEIERMAGQFRAAGHEIVSTPDQADLVVVNTCTVTAKAAADSRKQIRHAWRAGAAQVVATGCWATLDPAGAAALPGVNRVVVNEEKENLVAGILGLPAAEFDLEPLARQPLPGAHLRTRAFIKAQDGCDNHCTFCITRVARGASRSRPIAEVIRDVRRAQEGGVKEVVLTGVQIGSWGQDFETPRGLADLLEAVLSKTDIPRLRLSSLEPWDLGSRFFDLWHEARLCRHLHLPLQSGARGTLRRMARKTTPEEYAALLERARKVSPAIAVTTDIIAGFPGETEADFEESLAFVKRMEFAAGHVFTYSPREGTPAAGYPDQIDLQRKKERNAAFRQVLSESAERYREQFIGQTMPVLWEASDSLGPDGWQLKGLTDNYLRVTAAAPQPLWNQISAVRLKALTSGGLKGILA